jgi:hypothetical protein
MSARNRFQPRIDHDPMFVDREFVAATQMPGATLFRHPDPARIA